ncbi:MAG: hypothetical protein KKC79_01545, partial [Gammaproteobacteria bacterium]|nr:hypothetical protein [Gammaproteobacteria bacterium]
ALLACHRAHLESLPRPARERVHAAAVEATTLQRRLAAQEDVDALARLRDLDVEVLAPPEVDIAAMAAHCEAHRRERRAALPEGLVESYLQPAPSKPPALR